MRRRGELRAQLEQADGSFKSMFKLSTSLWLIKASAGGAP